MHTGWLWKRIGFKREKMNFLFDVNYRKLGSTLMKEVKRLVLKLEKCG